MARSNPDGGQLIPAQKNAASEVASDQEEFRPYVEWVGSAGYREVTDQQWRDAGIEDQGTVTWTRESPRVDLSELTDAARERLAAEPDFKFVHEAPKEDD